MVFGSGVSHDSRLHYVEFNRAQDVNHNLQCTRWFEGRALDATLASHHYLEPVFAPQYGLQDPPESALWIRLRRAGGLLAASWSDDGAVWHTSLERNTGSLLAGLEQRIVISGRSWFVHADSYADYHYVRVTGPDGELLVPPANWPDAEGPAHGRQGG